MVIVNVVVVNRNGLITSLVQRMLIKDSVEHRTLRKKYLGTNERDSPYTFCKVSYDVRTGHKIVWIETKISTKN